MSRSTSWDPDNYARNARFVSELGEPLLELLKPEPGEVILDVGCGDGALTKKIAGYGATVYGIDTSYPQIQAAKKRGLRVLVMDGHQLSFKERFDAVFTNAALHWMKGAEEVVRSVNNVLKPGGRFIGEFGGKGNVEQIRSTLHSALQRRAIDPAAIDPWYYPSAEEYSNLLGEAGFKVDTIELIPRPTKLPGGITGWLEVFAQPFSRAVPQRDRAHFLAEIIGELEPTLRDSAGNWYADYVRLRFYAWK
jgi:trans-aconitate methyltransferase